MVARLKLTVSVILAALVVVPAALQAQNQGRFVVMIPYFEPLEDADDDFGKDASKELRELINGLATHQPMKEGDIKDEAKRFDLKIEDLTCIQTRQLAAAVNVEVALCAAYTENADKSWTLNAEFWDIRSNESFKISETTVGEKEDAAAAMHIFTEFDGYVQQIRAAAFCADYATSQQWENALRQCDLAIDLNPGAVGTRYQRARIFYEMENYPDALTELEAVLEINGFHEDALQLGGFIATTEGLKEQARGYYGRYLDLNPGSASIRMNIAYELAKAGDPVGAMEFIQVGLDVDAENVDLWEQYGSFAFAAADAERAAAALTQPANGGDAPLSAEATGFYREAITAYEKVFAGKGEETPVGHLRNIMAAYIQLEELAAAIDVGERVVQTHSEEDVLWSIYADALQRDGQLDEAIAAIDRLKQINPDYPSASLRQGQWLIQAGRIDDAVAVLQGVAAQDAQQAEQAARMVFNDAYSKGYQKEDYAYSIAGMTAAKELPGISDEMRHQLNFWHGYSVYRLAVVEQGPNTLETAQSTLAKFQSAMALLRETGQYPGSVSVDLQELLGNVTTYVEIQEAIIKRGS